MKYGNLTFGPANVTHSCEVTYELFKEVKNVNVNLKIEFIWKWFINIFLITSQLHLIFKQKKPEVVIFEKYFNMCMIARIQTGNIFMKEFFRELLENIDFVMKCPFKKGVYRRKPNSYYNINSTGLSVPAFITYEKDFKLVQTYSTRVNGRIDDIVHLEYTLKLVH